MTRKIEFFNKDSGVVVEDKYLSLFVFGDGLVYQDNGETYQSHASTVCFDDFIEARPTLDWRVKST